MLKLKHHKVFISIVCILFVGIFIFTFISFLKNKSTRPDKYPILVPSEFYQMDENYQFDELINQSDIIIEVTVLTVDPKRIYHYTPPKNDPTYLVLL